MSNSDIGLSRGGRRHQILISIASQKANFHVSYFIIRGYLLCAGKIWCQILVTYTELDVYRKSCQFALKTRTLYKRGALGALKIS